MRRFGVTRLVLVAVLVGAAGVLAWFCVDNVNHYWEANHPPSGAIVHDVVLTRVDTEQVCGRTSKSTSTCAVEVDGVEFTGPDAAVQHADAHARLSVGDRVRAFQDSDGDWQVKGAFTLPWVLRTGGFTGVPAVFLLFVAAMQLRPAHKAAAAS